METKASVLNGPEDKWLTTADIMKKFGCSKRTVGRWRDEGMPHYNTGTMLHQLSEVLEWLKKRKRKKRSK